MQRVHTQTYETCSCCLLNNFNYPQHKNKSSRKNQAMEKNAFFHFMVQLFGIAGIVFKKAHIFKVTKNKKQKTKSKKQKAKSKKQISNKQQITIN
jgi:hypothetical protein